ncbi:MAG: hypothetical protein KC636_40060, partial [Myxococcales bacterium]|nr:hypothetical protein [Myxococcales bacterium]
MRSWPALLLAGAVLLTSACTAARVRTAAGVPRAREMKDVPASTLHVVDAARFGGTWYMIISDFPRWKSPRYRDPTYVYEPLDHPDLTLYRDSVHFQRNGRKRAWRGVDIQDPDRAGHFQW